MRTPSPAPALPQGTARNLSSSAAFLSGLCSGESIQKLLEAVYPPPGSPMEAKKRRPEDEAGEDIHLAFRNAANSLSQVYALATAQQKASFLAGERRAMEYVYQWISSQREEALEVSVADVLAYLENEIERRAGDISGSSQHPCPQPVHDFPSANVQSNAFSFANVADALNSQMDQTDQTRTAGISNELPSPSQQNFHSNHLIQCSGNSPINSLPNGKGAQNNHSPPNQESMHFNRYDTPMDMNHDAP